MVFILDDIAKDAMRKSGGKQVSWKMIFNLGSAVDMEKCVSSSNYFISPHMHIVI